MLLKASSIKGLPIEARDGQVGSVHDLLFEVDCWRVRWLAVDTGFWLFGRKVLLPVSHLGSLGVGASSVPVDLSRDQVEDSPGSGIDLPVSRRMESSIYGHYGWAPYWPAGAGAAFMSPLAAPAPLAPAAGMPGTPDAAAAGAPAAGPAGDGDGSEGDPHLRSAREVTGYAIQCRDDEVGHVEDLLVDGERWAIRYLIVDTRNWWPGRKVLVAPGWIEGIAWAERAVRVARTCGEIKAAPEYDPTRPVDRTIDADLRRGGRDPYGAEF